MKENATFIIAHDDLANTLLTTVEKIVGKQENVFPHSNKYDSISVLAEKINKNLRDHNYKHVVFFIDLVGGSCWSLSNMIQKNNPNIKLVSGVNLPMLTSYFTHIKEMPFTELIKKTLRDGTRGITIK